MRPPFLLFFLTFCHVFHSFFFSSFSQFFNFSVFREKCVSFFSFFFSDFLPLPAFVLGVEKRCFFRSRCSMEMWCPDGIGGDSWDWFGPPTRERA